jgi:hypothetical protein
MMPADQFTPLCAAPLKRRDSLANAGGRTFKRSIIDMVRSVQRTLCKATFTLVSLRAMRRRCWLLELQRAA